MLLTDQDSRDPLSWLSRILWPDGSGSIERTGSSPRWWASPSADNPKILIPADCPAAARTAVKRYHDGFSPKLRARSLAAEATMRWQPLAGALLDKNLVGMASTDDGEPTGVLEGIRRLLGVPNLYVAFSLSTPKSNQKPVLQLLDERGRCLGWAKVAWNDRTSALVANEAHWLRHRAEPPLSIPELLHDTEIAGRRVAISSGVDVSRRPRRSPSAMPSFDVFHSVAALGTAATVDIETSTWWRSVERVLHHGTDRERDAVRAAADSCAGLRIRVGAWHGDLTPWNLMTSGNRTHLIDWEFAADGVPFGFDLCHFNTQVASEMKASTADSRRVALDAIDHSARLSPQGLAGLGIEPENRTAIWRLYLVELVRRSVALRANGYPMDRVMQGAAALDRLERAVGGHTVDPVDDDDSPRATAAPAADDDRWNGVDRRSDRDGDSGAGSTDSVDSTDSPGSTDSADSADREVDGGPSTFADLLACGDGDGYTIRDHKTGANAR